LPDIAQTFGGAGKKESPEVMKPPGLKYVCGMLNFSAIKTAVNGQLAQ